MKSRMIKKLLMVMVVSAVVATAGCGSDETVERKERAVITDEADEEAEEDDDNLGEWTDVTKADEEDEDEDDQKETGSGSSTSMSNLDLSVWQQAYMDILDQIILTIDVNDTEAWGYTNYSLYDLTYDGIPELILVSGTCEADVSMVVFTCDEDGNVTDTGMLPYHHMLYYTDPEGKGIIGYYGHMGYMEISRYTLGDDGFEYESLYSENMEEKINANPDYVSPEPGDIIEGSTVLVDFPLTYTYGIYAYAGEDKNDGEKLSDAEIEEIVEKVINMDEDAYFVAANPENIQAKKNIEGSKILSDIYGDIFPFSDGKNEIKDVIYHDFNDDGQNECLLVITEDANNNMVLIVLAVQDGQTYGYVGTNCGTYNECVVENNQVIVDQSWAIKKHTFYFMGDQGFMDVEYEFTN